MEQYLSNWIWTPSWDDGDDLEAKLIYFRKTMEIPELPTQFIVKISADSRYKLFVNQQLVEVGPSKGDNEVWYYDVKDLSPFLKEGSNAISVEVLRYPIAASKGNRSVWRTQTPGLYFCGSYETAEGSQTIIADSSWKCYTNHCFKIVPETPHNARLQFYEETNGNPDVFGWKQDTFDDTCWVSAKPYYIFGINKAESPGNLLPRTIPYTTQYQRNFNSISKLRQTQFNITTWEHLLHKKSALTVPPHSKEIVEIDAGELMNGFIQLAFSGGMNSKISILYSESYAQSIEGGDLPIKKNRLDSKNGQLYGYTDIYTVGGYGSAEDHENYEPFWFRTFRFIRLEIKTENDPLVLEQFDYRETGYPLDIKSYVETSDVTHSGIWEISERTLKRCMVETYMDCPFYEQLQYIMDSRSQILYTYAISGDDRLARKCLDDFRRSQRYDGMLNACYPSVKSTVIPGFSIYYILMLSDHMMYFGDKNIINEHLPTVERILQFFINHLNSKGLVEGVGGELMKDKYWSFVDWTPQWDKTAGVPTSIKHGPLTMESLLFLLGLQEASKLEYFTGNTEKANYYLDISKDLKSSINENCVDVNGYYQDGPGINEYSQHAQVFAILTESVDAKQGANLLKRALDDDTFARCSVAMMYYLFRALEKVGSYQQTENLWQIWREMLDNNLTTCVEDSVNSRSDCHAWGALILYELPATVLGVRPLEPGFKKIRISPIPGYLTWAKGSVTTPYGEVSVSWSADSAGRLKSIDCNIPDGIEAIVSTNNGEDI